MSYSNKHKTHVSGQAPLAKAKLHSGGPDHGTSPAAHDRKYLRDYALLRTFLRAPEACMVALRVSANQIATWDQGQDLRALRRLRKDLARLRQMCELLAAALGDADRVPDALTTPRPALHDRSLAEAATASASTEDIKLLVQRLSGEQHDD